MKNPLFISDLDGTLLNGSGLVSPQSVRLLNRCIGEGMLFSIATARTPATVVELLKEIHVSLPIVVITGGGIFDLQTKKYLHTESFSPASTNELLEVFESHSLSVLAHTLKGERLEVYYQRLTFDFERDFVAARAHTPYKSYIRQEGYTAALKGNPVLLFLAINRFSVLEEIYEYVRQIPGINSYCYPDGRHPEYGYLEIFPAKVSKASAIRSLVERSGADGVISFGDSVNDLSMFQISDESYATANGMETAKAAAGSIIPSNEEDGVALTAYRRFHEIRAEAE